MPVSKEKFYMSGRDIRKHGQLNIKPDQKWTYSELDQIGFGGLAAMDSALTGPAMSGGFIQRSMCCRGLSVPLPASVCWMKSPAY